MATKRQLKKQDAMKAKTTKAVTEVAEAAADIKDTTETKVAEVKKATEEKAAEVKKVAAKAVSETKETVKKAVAKKPAAKKEMKTTIVVEYQEKQVDEKTMVAAVKKAWQKSGNKVGDIKTMTLYVKPEEDAIYYVINDTETGKAAF